VRDTLVARGLLSYRLVWFEDAPPEEFPPDVCAAVTTHDLPTIAGMWTGADAEVQRSIGVPAPEEGARLMHERLRRVGGVGADAPVREVIDAVYARLTRSPAAVVLAPLEDALGVTERPNQPGTVDEWPNWRLALPAPLEQLTADPRVRSLAATLGVRGRPAG
jgi:4-alpha-glucanotransferase